MAHVEDVVADLVEVVDVVQCGLSHLDHVEVVLGPFGHGEDDSGDHALVDLDDLGLERPHGLDDEVPGPCCGGRCLGVGRHAHGGHGEPLDDDLGEELVLVADVHEDEHGDGTLRALSWSENHHDERAVDESDDDLHALSRSLRTNGDHGSSHHVMMSMTMRK